MKKLILITTCLVTLSFTAIAQCFNAGLEQGSFANWTGYTGLNTQLGLDLNTFTQGITASQFAITQTGTFDPVVAMNALKTTIDGNHAIQLGNHNTLGHSAQIASYTVHVTPQKTKFSFRFAVVMVDPGHGIGDNPFFSFWASTTNVLNQSNQPGNLISTTQIVADQNNPFFTLSESNQGGQVLYKDWQTECFDFTDFIGQDITIYFATASCPFGAKDHYCYAYIDGLCSNNDPVPSFTCPTFICNSANLSNIIVDGSASENYNEFKWEIREDGNSSTTVVSQTFVNTPIPSNFDISQLYLSGGQTFRNTTYRVRLFVKNCTGNWVSQTQFIEVHEPEITVEDKYACCNNGDPVDVILEASVVVKTGALNPLIEWYDKDDNFLGNGNTNMSVSGSTTTLDNDFTIQTAHNNKYRVVYTDDNGCTNEAWVYVLIMAAPNSVSISEECTSVLQACGSKKLILNDIGVPRCGNAPLWAHADQYVNRIKNTYMYLWSTGETTKEITYNPATPSYTATVSNQCFSKTAVINVAPNPFPGSLPTMQNLWVTTHMSSNLDFVIKQASSTSFPAYNSNYYKLTIFNQWGEIVYQKEETSCLGFAYDHIRWNGVGNYGWHNGSPQPTQQYEFTLYLGNCDNPPTFIPFNNYSFLLIR